MKQTKLDAIKGGLTSPRPGQDEPDTAQLAKAAGLTLSPVRSTDIGKLKENPISAKHFRDLAGADFEKLKADIQARGVLVPLVAMKDGTLLAGHNRLRAAKQAGLEKIPVQWVEDELSRKDQEGFVIKDNVLRRQLSAEEKEALIVSLYGKQIEESKHGGDRKGIKIQVNLAKQVEQDTGIKAGTAQRIIAKHRKAQAAQRPQPPQTERQRLKADIKATEAKIKTKQREVKELRETLARLKAALQKA